MKNIVIILGLLCVVSCPVQSAVTTSDGAITIDFYEDMDVPNRWVLDFKVNQLDASSPDYFESLSFLVTASNWRTMYFDHEENADTDYYNIWTVNYGLVPSPIPPEIHDPSGDPPSAGDTDGGSDSGDTTSASIFDLIRIIHESPYYDPNPYYREHIYTEDYNSPTPAGAEFFFYANPREDGELLVDEFNITVKWWSSDEDEYTGNKETLTLTGPVGFAVPVPEPMSTALFAFGALVMGIIAKRSKRVS